MSTAVATADVALPGAGPVDGEHLVSGGSLAFVRASIGVLGAVSCWRMLVNGWVSGWWVDPAHHFHWPGLWWVRPLPSGWMHVFVASTGGLFAVAAIRSLRGRPSRGWLLAATGCFVYLGVIDVAPYLNHYLLLAIAGVVAGVNAEGQRVQRWAVTALRVVVATTYVWAAIAKVAADWLSGRTLRPWLASHVDWPIIGASLRYSATAQALAIAGLVFDASIIALLRWRRTRRVAYVVVVAFHVATAALFPIGMFPWIMIALTTIFFEPAWFDRWLQRLRSRLADSQDRPALVRRRVVAGACVLAAVLPIRSYLGAVGWTEYGGRTSWRVMAVNKVASASLIVRPRDGGEPIVVFPQRDLSPLQAQQVGWQPDLILQWADIVAAAERQARGADVAVYADIWVSVNGAPPVQFVDPTVDLTRIEPSLLPPSWLLQPP